MAAKDSNFRISATPVTVFAHLLAIAIFTLVLVWALHFRGGLALSSNNKQKIFNVHPVLMVIGFILCGGEAIMAYKTVPGSKQKIPKVFHLILHLIALVVGIIGVYAVIKFHNELGIPNVYTLHSWIGISTISLFGLQSLSPILVFVFILSAFSLEWLLGFSAFWFPGAPSRSNVLPWHWFLGMAIFLMGIVSAETGLVEKFNFLNLLRQQEALIMNFLGLLILLFGASVALSVALPKPNE